MGTTSSASGGAAADDGEAEAMAKSVEAMPVELVEVRPGRSLAVHRRQRRGAVPLGRGGGDVAFLVHGSCASMLQYREQAEFLSESYDVVAFDYLGCGRSPKPEGWAAYSTDELFEDLVAVVKRFGAKPGGGGGNVVVAHSFGCALALRLAIAEAAADGSDGAAKLRALVLLGPVDSTPAVASGPLFRLPVSVLKLMQPKLNDAFETLALTEGTRSSDKKELRSVVALARATNKSNPMHMCKAFYRQLSVPSKEDVARVRAPTLLLHGDADKIVEPEASARLEALLSGVPADARRRELVEGASHQLMQEQPAAVNEAIRRFLDGLAAGAS